jgi:ABC-type transporter Mla subunit MlaD
MTDAMYLVIGDLSADCIKVTDRLGDALADQYEDLMGAELKLLGDSRAAFEATMNSLRDEAKLSVIYNMHVLQYAGGADRGPFGFGAAASSFYGKGNQLTGVDELDLFRVEGSNQYGYAQVANEELASPGDIDAHHATLKSNLDSAKAGFDEAIAACIADFEAHATSEHQEAADTW